MDLTTSLYCSNLDEITYFTARLNLDQTRPDWDIRGLLKKKLSLTAGLAAILALAAGGCGAVIDYARDNELRWGFLNSPSFVSPARLKVGVFPFQDSVGLGAPGAGLNLARMLSEELAKNSNLVVAPVEKMAAALSAWDYEEQLTPASLARIGSELGLNAVVLGSVSEISTYSQRKGWRDRKSVV